MSAHSDHVALHETHRSMPTRDFASIEKYVLYLMHVFPYLRLSQLAAGKAVLDLGCNNGYGCDILADEAARVIGVDVSQSVIDEATERFAHRSIDFARIDGAALPFADGEFDIVVSCQVIEHVVDRDAYLAEIARVLAPDGFALFTTPNRCIRLDPGMAPWNRFHVTEFAPGELKSVMYGGFPAAAVRGLFGSAPVHRVEADRVARRLRGKRANDFARLTGRAVKTPPRDARRERAGTQDLAAFVAAHSVADLRWQGERLDEALDLMAVCARDASTVNQTLAALCAD